MPVITREEAGFNRRLVGLGARTVALLAGNPGNRVVCATMAIGH